MRTIIFGLAVAAALLSSVAAQALPKIGYADHNGSMMKIVLLQTGKLQWDVKISYQDPSYDMLSAGVVPGTPFFRGRAWFNGRSIEYVGAANVFQAGCFRPYSYPVHGGSVDGNSLDLMSVRGAPIVDRCVEVGRAFNSPNNFLHFEPLGQE